MSTDQPPAPGFLPGSDIAAYVTTAHRLRDHPAELVHRGPHPSSGRERLVEPGDASSA